MDQLLGKSQIKSHPLIVTFFSYQLKSSMQPSLGSWGRVTTICGPGGFTLTISVWSGQASFTVTSSSCSLPTLCPQQATDSGIICQYDDTISFFNFILISYHFQYVNAGGLEQDAEPEYCTGSTRQIHTEILWTQVDYSKADFV